jgi:glutathione S-transferase
VLNLDPVKVLTGGMANALTGGLSSPARPSRAPPQPLELWSFEASPYCRFVRETLCELELPYLLHNVAKGSPRRKEYIAMSGEMKVPYLLDPNTGQRMFESMQIRRYLETTYGTPAPSA